MNESYAREEICRIGRSLFERGYVHATAGNISLRLDNGILITPSDACLGFLDPARIAQINLNGQQQGGDQASKTLALHQAIYRASRPFLPYRLHHSHPQYVLCKPEPKLKGCRVNSPDHALFCNEGWSCPANSLWSTGKSGGC